MPARILLLCVLVGSLIFTVIMALEDGFAIYDIDNIRKMWISIGIIAAFALFMTFALDQLMITFLPILVIIDVIVVGIVKNW